MTVDLAKNEVRVRWVATSDAENGSLRDRYRALMNDAERVRHDRLLVPHVAHELLVTRALARTTLAAIVGVAPSDLTFQFNEWGRPEIDLPASARALRFNLSNTVGLVAIAVTWDRDVGIDIEDVSRSVDASAIADRYFSKTEVRELLSLPEPARKPRFFDYWTLKEAYIKARGMGLAIPLDGFSFRFDAGPVRLDVDAALADDGAHWQWEQRALTDTHLMALAIRRGLAADVPIRVERCVPLLTD